MLTRPMFYSRRVYTRVILFPLTAVRDDGTHTNIHRKNRDEIKRVLHQLYRQRSTFGLSCEVSAVYDIHIG